MCKAFLWNLDIFHVVNLLHLLKVYHALGMMLDVTAGVRCLQKKIKQNRKIENKNVIVCKNV